MKNQHFVIKNADFVYKKEKSRKIFIFFGSVPVCVMH